MSIIFRVRPGPRFALGGWSARCGLVMALLMALFTALLLAGCGPGVGGTGTGESQAALRHFGATPASACGSDLGPLLACAAGNATAAPAPSAGPVYLADTIDGRLVSVRVMGNLLEVEVPCARLRFSGEWGVIAGQPARFYGFATVDGSTVPATLDVQGSSAGLQLTVRNQSGQVLLGPVLVVVAPAPAAPGSCG